MYPHVVFGKNNEISEDNILKYNCRVQESNTLNWCWKILFPLTIHFPNMGIITFAWLSFTS